MIDTPTPPNVAAYLRELDAALSTAPAEVRAEIVAGIEEELVGLDAATAATRIDELGDPVFIAAEATGATTPDSPTRTTPGGYSILTVVLLIIGGFVVPVIGWIVGAVLLVASSAWTRRDKLIGTLVPALTFVVATTVFLLLRGPDAGVPAFIIGGAVTFIVGLLSGIRLLRRASH